MISGLEDESLRFMYYPLLKTHGTDTVLKNHANSEHPSIHPETSGYPTVSVMNEPAPLTPPLEEPI